MGRTGAHGNVGRHRSRLLVDLAGRVSPDLVEEAVDDVLCRRLTTVDAVERRAADLGPRRGSAVLRTVLDAWLPDELPANVAEMRVLRAILRHGLPRRVCQYETRIEGVLVARVDFAYPADRVAIEFDSFRWHAGRRPFASDRARANRIEALGWHLLRVTPDDVRRGAHELCAALGALLRAAA